MKQIYALLIPAAIIILFPSLLTAITPVHNVTGILQDEELNPVTEHPVLLYGEEGELIATDTTDGAGNFTLSYEEIEPVSIEMKNGTTPASFRLGSSYPNPFNPRSSVPIDLPRAITAEISLHTILGEQILRRTFSFEAGSHVIDIHLGGRLSQGQYLLRVHGGGFTATEKMTFLSAGISGGTPSISISGSGREANQPLVRRDALQELSADSLQLHIPGMPLYFPHDHFVKENVSIDVGVIVLESAIVQDIDENVYQAARIGDQVWMAKNLRTTRYRDGSVIPTGLTNNSWSNTTEGAYAIYPHEDMGNLFNDEQVAEAYGLLYNWFAVTDSAKLCPAGWRIPSKEDWAELIDYIGGITQGNALKSRRQVNSPFGSPWQTTDHPRWVSHNIHYGTDDYGFSGLPSASRAKSGLYNGVGFYANFWSSSEYDEEQALLRMLHAGEDTFNEVRMAKQLGYSVRCLRGEVPELTTKEVTEITDNSAVSGGEITDDGRLEITARGVVWSTEEHPTLENYLGKTEDGAGTGTFTSNLTDLNPVTTYYVRAWAANKAGISYGGQVVFQTGTEVVEVTNPETGRVWMDRNLGAGRAAASSFDEEAYGDLYQWGRAPDGHQLRSSPSTSFLSDSDDPGHGLFILSSAHPWDWRHPQKDDLWEGVNGINNPCPDGFRLPTEAEWIDEKDSWTGIDSDGAFNSKLKLPLPGSRSRSNGFIFDEGELGIYWSSTVFGSNVIFLIFDFYFANTRDDSRAGGYSVRCIKD